MAEPFKVARNRAPVSVEPPFARKTQPAAMLPVPTRIRDKAVFGERDREQRLAHFDR